MKTLHIDLEELKKIKTLRTGWHLLTNTQSG